MQVLGQRHMHCSATGKCHQIGIERVRGIRQHNLVTRSDQPEDGSRQAGGGTVSDQNVRRIGVAAKQRTQPFGECRPQILRTFQRSVMRPSRLHSFVRCHHDALGSREVRFADRQRNEVPGGRRLLHSAGNRFDPANCRTGGDLGSGTADPRVEGKAGHE
ncbi:hypothetical protein SDC9_140428 [bioreactor metagenome]|uniref:Uncharacterized protein n=1 Tax=bioreactor metagenome TaxID=1076179 RepID=A0A645DY83_9ZZZZ